MTNTQHHPAALAVANWWADKAGIVTGNGDQSSMGGMVTALAVLSGAQGECLAANKRAAFVNALAQRVTNQIERSTDNPSWAVTIGVDYGPDQILADAAAEASVSAGAFPWKTMTWTYPTHVVTALGYGARGSLTWQADDWERPMCGQGQWDLEHPDGGRLPWKCSSLMYHDGEHSFDLPEPLCFAMTERFGRPHVCNSPERHENHLTDDSYYGKFAHAFQPTAQVSA